MSPNYPKPNKRPQNPLPSKPGTQPGPSGVPKPKPGHGNPPQPPRGFIEGEDESCDDS